MCVCVCVRARARERVRACVCASARVCVWSFIIPASISVELKFFIALSGDYKATAICISVNSVEYMIMQRPSDRVV